jgi:glycosyltransferase involved in cell wall biosynthesis
MYNLMWKLGGVSLFLFQVMRALSHDSRLEIYLVCEAIHPKFKRQMQEAGVNVVETGFSRSGLGDPVRAGLGWMLLPVSGVKRVRKVISRINPDLINPHDFPDILYASSYKGHIDKDVSLCWYCHEPFRPFYDVVALKQPANERIFFAMYRKLLSATEVKHVRTLVDAIGANSRYTAESVMKIYGRNAKVIYPGVDVGRFRRTPSDVKSIMDADHLIASVGAIDFGSKNLGIVPAVLHEIRKRYDVKWIHVGQGRDRARLLTLAGYHGVLQHLKIIDYAEEDELIKYYSAADVVVYPSIQEPFGVVPVESMACETPVVASKFGGSAETVLDGETGLLTDMNRVGKVAGAVSYLLENELAARKMGVSGRRRVSKFFSLEKTIRDFSSLVHMPSGEVPVPASLQREGTQ